MKRFLQTWVLEPGRRYVLISMTSCVLLFLVPLWGWTPLLVLWLAGSCLSYRDAGRSGIRFLHAALAVLFAALALMNVAAALRPTSPGESAADLEVAAANTANDAVRALYTADEAEAAALDAALTDGDTAALEEQMRDDLNGGITDAGVQSAMENRVPTRIAAQWPGQAVTVQKIRMGPSYTATDTEQYFQYSLTAGPEDGEGQAFSGEITLVLQDGAWLVDGVS